MFAIIAVVALLSHASAQLSGSASASASAFGSADVAASSEVSSRFFGTQQSIKFSIDLAVNDALGNLNVATLPLALQQELQTAIASAELGLANCENWLITWNVWRYKICRVQVLSQLTLRIQEIRASAALYSTSTTASESVTASATVAA